MRTVCIIWGELENITPHADVWIPYLDSLNWMRLIVLPLDIVTLMWSKIHTVRQTLTMNDDSVSGSPAASQWVHELTFSFWVLVLIEY